MEQEEVIRFLNGQQKKHGKDFGVQLKYRTTTGKVKKRHGNFVALRNDWELVLYNPDKKTEGRYLIENIEEIKKR
jgi:hypothetical protein